MRRMAWSARRAALLDPSAVDVNRKTSSTTQAQKPCSILPHSRILPPSGRGSNGSVIMAAPAPGKAKAAHEHSSAEASGLHAANLSALVLPESSTNFGDMQPLPSWRQHIAQDSRVLPFQSARLMRQALRCLCYIQIPMPTASGKNSG